jgi:hypothetical protein
LTLTPPVAPLPVIDALFQGKARREGGKHDTFIYDFQKCSNTTYKHDKESKTDFYFF